MNISGIFGLLAAIGLIFFGMTGQGDPASNFWDPTSIALVLGGTFGSLLIGVPFKVIKNIPKTLGIVFKPKKLNPEKYIESMVDYAKIARTKSLLALEDSANECKDPFMKSSLLLIVDANDSDRVKEMLDDAIDFMSERHEENWSLWFKMSSAAPGFGMIGTLVGLINMLANLSGDPDSLGAGMSVALITTFYGSLLANLIATPIANRLVSIHAQEVLCMQIVEQGALAIISGANPRYIQEKLEFMLPKDKKKGAKSKGSGSNK